MSAVMNTETRQALIDAGIKGLMSDGWAAIRMRDLAEMVGIRAPSIYHHFKTKADLGLAMVDYLHAMMRDQVQAINAKSESLLDRVLQFASADDHVPMFGGSCPIYNLQAEYAVLPEGMQKAVQKLVEEMVAALSNWVVAAQANGEIDRACEPRTQACIVLSICEHGLQLQLVLDTVAMTQLVQGWYSSLRNTPRPKKSPSQRSNS